MPYTVPYSFSVFYDNINLSGDHRSIANTRRDDIVTKLSKSFDVIESFSTGSVPKYTALKNHADLDVMVALHYGKHIKDKKPSELLQDVRKCLAEWRTGVRRNGQAVTLHYATWPNVDIVPVSRFTNADGSFSHYEVPDSTNETWIKSRPTTLASDIKAKSNECGANFRRIIKMVKHWNRKHSSYLQSYHIEVLALRTLRGDLTDLPWHIYKFFEDARELLNSYVWYDVGFADDYLSFSDRVEAKKRFDTAISVSRAAWAKTYGEDDDHQSAIELWRQLFGSEFPAYG